MKEKVQDYGPFTKQQLWEAIKDLRITSQRDLAAIQSLEKRVRELEEMYNLHLHNLHGTTLQSP